MTTRLHPHLNPLSSAEELRQILMDVLHASQQQWEEAQVRVNQSVGGVMLRGANVVQIGGGTGGTTRPITSAATLLGWALRETAGAAATIRLRDGSDSGAPVILPIQLGANESTRDWFGPGGLSISEGIYVDYTGAIEGAVFLRGSD